MCGEVANYVAALDHGVKRLHELPLWMRLIGEIHAVLSRHPSRPAARPGRVRTLQVWIGGTRHG